MKLIYFSLLLLLTATSPSRAYAQSGPATPSGPPAKIGIDVAIGAFYSLDNMKNQTGTIRDRRLQGANAFLTAGITFGFITPLMYADYSYNMQLTPTEEVGNSNLSGSGFIFGQGAKFSFGKVSLTAVYGYVGSYNVRNTTSSGLTTTFQSPESIIVHLNYLVRPNVTLSLVGKQTKYGKQKVGETTETLSGNELMAVSYGVGVSYDLF